MDFGLAVWNTGIAPQPLIRSLDPNVFAKDKWHHLLTDPSLHVLGFPRVASSTASTVSTATIPAQSSDQPSAATAKPEPLPGIFAMGDCASVGDSKFAATAQVGDLQSI